MAGGGFVVGNDARKIKGGRWTVFRFFLVSVAFTSAWVAVSSQLSYYRHLHGPAVLLQLNIAYFMPSIPLLIVSAFLDKPLEARLGVAKTILVRLLVGLLGYGGICAWFPFMPEHIWFLLGAVVALGLFSGVAFSASYQLVARFANKNVIALGLGCSASGPLVLLMQLALRMGPTPTRKQQILLYETIALVIVGGLWATVSLLLRHWKSIEAHASKQDLAEPLLPQDGGAAAAAAAGSSSPSTPTAAAAAAVAAAAAEAGGYLQPPERPPPLSLGATVWKQTSLPPLLAYNSLEPYQTFLSTDQEPFTASSSWSESSLLADVAAGAAAPAAPGDTVSIGGGGGGQTERQLSAPPAALLGSFLEDESAAVAAVWGKLGSPGAAARKFPEDPRAAAGAAAARGHGMSPLQVHAHGFSHQTAAAGAAAAGEQQQSAAGGGSGSAGLQALKLIWAPLAALSLSSAIALTLFPFFTYVPTSGLLGETLPKVLFFVRIFADVCGRFLPRLSPFAAKSPLTPLAAACVKLACAPLFLLYLKSPDRMHSDVAAVVFVGLLWVLGGYINTMSNMLAPKLVPPHLKGTAAGIMAIAYQVAHFLGLAIATLAALLMFGHIGVE